jgi:hypothetical protein
MLDTTTLRVFSVSLPAVKPFPSSIFGRLVKVGTLPFSEHKSLTSFPHPAFGVTM